MVKDHKGDMLRKLLWLVARATADYMITKHMDDLKIYAFSFLLISLMLFPLIHIT